MKEEKESNAGDWLTLIISIAAVCYGLYFMLK